MAEVTCQGCGGLGFISTPHAAVLPDGSPHIELVMSTCMVCHGNGMVDDGS